MNNCGQKTTYVQQLTGETRESNLNLSCKTYDLIRNERGSTVRIHRLKLRCTCSMVKFSQTLYSFICIKRFGVNSVSAGSYSLFWIIGFFLSLKEMKMKFKVLLNICEDNIYFEIGLRCIWYSLKSLYVEFEWVVLLYRTIK